MATTKKRKPASRSKSRSKTSVKERGRQLYSEIGVPSTSSRKKSAGSRKSSSTKKAPSKASSAKRSANVPTRELLSDIAKVGRKFKSRVKRAL